MKQPETPVPLTADDLCLRIGALTDSAGAAPLILVCDVRFALASRDAALAKAEERAEGLRKAFQRDIGDGFNDCSLCEVAWLRGGLTGELHAPGCIAAPLVKP